MYMPILRKIKVLEKIQAERKKIREEMPDPLSKAILEFYAQYPVSWLIENAESLAVK